MKYTIWNIDNKFDATYLINTDKKLLIGDLIKIDRDFFLVKNNLGEGKEINTDFDYIGNLFSSTTVMFQQFLANYWYSWYFKFFNLYIQDTKYILKYDLPQVKREKKLNLEGAYISEYKKFDTYGDYLKMGDDSIKIIDYKYFDNFTPGKGQNLFIFPDLWSINCFTSKIAWKYDIVNVSGTSLQRYKTFLDIKLGKKQNIITTGAGVFQDWKNLKRIYLFQPYKWYYKNQQNPRYHLQDLVKQIKFFYGVEELFYILP